MSAPVDIIISIIKRHERETREAKAEAMAASGGNINESSFDGRLDAYAELIEELEGFKKLFS